MVAPPLFRSHHEHDPHHFINQHVANEAPLNLQTSSDNLPISCVAPQKDAAVRAPAGPTALSINIDTDKFEQLVEDIHRVLGPTKGIDDIDVEQLMEIMKNYDPTVRETEWNKYALNDPSRNYTRNGVDDINKKANLLILVWNPMRGSMIHDHANAHCIVKLLKGNLRETLYDWPSSDGAELHENKVTDIEVGQVTYMCDNIGLHRMYNPHPTEVAVSLHLYTPPYAAKFGCHIYDQESGKSHLVNMSTLYSIKGVRCSEHSDSC